MEAWKEAWLRNTIGYTVLELPNGNDVLTWNFRYRIEAPLKDPDMALIDCLRGLSGALIEAQLKVIRAVIAITEAKTPEDLQVHFESDGTYAMAEEARKL